MNTLPETIGLKEAAALLKLYPATVSERAKKGLIPGCKPGKMWVFVKEDLVEYLRSGYSGRASQGVKLRRKEQWHSGTETVSGGLISRITEEEYENLLKRGIKSKPKNIMIG